MATFSVRFLGCKVSHVDAQEIRERLLAEGHSEVEGGAALRLLDHMRVTASYRLLDFDDGQRSPVAVGASA